VASLRVFANLRPMGAFGFEAGQFFFEYDAEWLALEPHYVLSPQFPLRAERFEGASVKFFFQNLLPEGSVLEAISHETGIELGNLFGLLAHLGRDCAGAISLLPEGQAPVAAQTYRSLDVELLRERIANRATHPLIASNPGSSMSLAGAQDKVGVRFDPKSGRLWEPVADSPSTHILKPENRNPQYPSCVMNEYISLRLARRVGLPAVNCWRLPLPEPVLIVERYDRADVDGNIVRRHQVDFCQLLDKDGFFKYERNAALIGLPQIFARAGEFVASGRVRLSLVDWVVFNFLIGNADAHAKNLSALVTPEGLRLAPFYDLLCVTAYGDERLALHIGDAGTFAEVTSVQWEAFCADCGLGFAEFRKRLEMLAKRVVQGFALETKSLDYPSDEDARIIDRMHATIQAHARFVRQALRKD